MEVAQKISYLVTVVDMQELTEKEESKKKPQRDWVVQKRERMVRGRSFEQIRGSRWSRPCCDHYHLESTMGENLHGRQDRSSDQKVEHDSKSRREVKVKEGPLPHRAPL